MLQLNHTNINNGYIFIYIFVERAMKLTCSCASAHLWLYILYVCIMCELLIVVDYMNICTYYVYTIDFNILHILYIHFMFTLLITLDYILYVHFMFTLLHWIFVRYIFSHSPIHTPFCYIFCDIFRSRHLYITFFPQSNIHIFS